VQSYNKIKELRAFPRSKHNIFLWKGTIVTEMRRRAQ
jgi:hypothetical protein